jgi:hypothetical protein
MSVVDVNPMVANADALSIKDPNTFKFGGCMLVDDSNKLFGSLG